VISITAKHCIELRTLSFEPPADSPAAAEEVAAAADPVAVADVAEDMV
jgi:hypothetical protein